MTSIHRHRRLTHLAALLALAVLPCGSIAAQDEVKPETDDQKALYAIGTAIAGSLVQLGLSEEEVAFVLAGVEDQALKRQLKVEPQSVQSQVQTFAQARISAAQEVEKGASAEFLAKMAAEDGAERLESGLIYTEMTAGEGANPTATDTVTVHYHGTLRDGSVFDSSRDRGQPATFALNQVIPCWTEGLQKLKPGGKSRLVCPSSIAYGDRGFPPKIGPGAALVFEVELIEIKSAAATNE